MRSFKLPKKIKRFLVPGVLLLSFFLLVGGLYFWKSGLIFSPQAPIGEEGTVAGTRTDVPKNFPPDVPIFEPAEITSSLESQERIQLTLQTEASAGRVSNFYQQQMKESGWKLTGRGMANENGVLSFSKDTRHTQVIITSDPEGPTLIVLGIRH